MFSVFERFAMINDAQPFKNNPYLHLTVVILISQMLRVDAVVTRKSTTQDRAPKRRVNILSNRRISLTEVSRLWRTRCEMNEIGITEIETKRRDARPDDRRSFINEEARAPTG